MERSARARRRSGVLDRISPVYCALALVVLATAVLAAVLTGNPLVRLLIVVGAVVASCCVVVQLWRQAVDGRRPRR